MAFKSIKQSSKSGWRDVPIVFEKSKPIRIPVSKDTSKGTYQSTNFQQYLGKWTNFKTRWGSYRGIIEDIQNDAVLIKMPKELFQKNLAPRYTTDIRTAGFDGCFPHFIKGPWCWCWFPIIIIIFIFPWFCW